MLNHRRRLTADESGTSATEYAILLAFVGAAVVVATGGLTGAMVTMFTNLTSKMATWIS
jgi:Flp pilus assembly pilin Flp